MAMSLILLALTPFLLLLTTTPQVHALTALAPEPPGPANITGIFDKAGQFTTFIRLLTSTQVANQIENQLNSSDQGLTILAPTDNAFSSLKPGTLNSLSVQEQVELVLYHVLPRFYSLAMFETVSNPVRTQATGEDGGAFGLNFTSSGNQVNVSSGMVATQLNTVLSKDFPLAMYQVDKVLLPMDIFGPKPPKAAPSPKKSPGVAKPKSPAAKAPATSRNDAADSNLGTKGMNVGISGMLIMIGSLCMGFL